MDIYQIIADNACTSNFIAKSKADALRKMALLLAACVKSKSSEEIYRALQAREKMGSTGFENGVAIPHARLKGLKQFVLGILISRKGIDFKSIDRKKSHLFFVFIGPAEQEHDHLKLLAQISRISRNPNAHQELLRANTSQSLKEAFYRYTSGEPQPKQSDEKQTLFILLLKEIRFYENIIELFIEQDIHTASIFTASGVKEQLSNIPLFGDFLNFLGNRPEEHKVIMAIVAARQVEVLVSGIEDIMGDLNKHPGAVALTTDLTFIKGKNS